jgi:ABC-2 type transport system ATP-binding protein
MLRVIFRVPVDEFTTTMKRLNEALNLEPLLTMPVRKLSLGQRMRCDIAASLLHKPDVLFLDEPTIGLDVVAKENIRTFLAEINRERGTTIILTTHDMNDIEQLCGRLIILDQGKAVFDGETSALKSRFGSDKLIEVEFHDVEGVGRRIEKIDGITLLREEGNKLWLRYANGSDGIGGLIGDMAKEYTLKDLSVKEPSVESIIRTIYQKRVALPKHENGAAQGD